MTAEIGGPCFGPAPTAREIEALELDWDGTGARWRVRDPGGRDLGAWVLLRHVRTGKLLGCPLALWSDGADAKFSPMGEELTYCAVRPVDDIPAFLARRPHR